jgi:hypothetical protein
VSSINSKRHTNHLRFFPAYPSLLVRDRVARYFLVKIPKLVEMYQMTTKCTKRPSNIRNGHKIYQHLPIQGPPKYNKIGTFGLKIYHLATLVRD